jgi:DNA-binding NarL/FixJ family response regulator
VQADVVRPAEVLDDREVELRARLPHAIGDRLGLETVDEARSQRVVAGVADGAIEASTPWSSSTLHAANPRAQALVLSASLDPKDHARAIQSGAAATLDKTAELDELVQSVRRLHKAKRSPQRARSLGTRCWVTRKRPPTRHAELSLSREAVAS